jgi:hypothetical protein
MSVSKIGLVQLNVKMNLTQNNAPHLIFEQSCTDNFIPRISQYITNNIDYVEPEESNYVLIFSSLKIEDDDNEEEEDYVVERGDSEDSSSEDIDDE